MDRPKSQMDEIYERMCTVIVSRGGKAPKADEPGSLGLMGEFFWAVDCVPRIELTRIVPPADIATSNG